MHTVKWFQILIFNISYSIYQVFQSNTNNLCTPVWFQITNNNSPFKIIEPKAWASCGTLINTTNLAQSGPESDGSELLLNIAQSSRTKASLSDAL